MAYLFRHDWGADTLRINGRFRASFRAYRSLTRQLVLASLQNRGLSLTWPTLWSREIRRSRLF
jgi:hypothetical protein